MDTAAKLAEYGKKIGSDILFAGVPKTIDNDLVLTDHTPGYGSAAKYIGTSVKEIIRDSWSLETTSGQVIIVEVMGRNAGYIALWCGIAAGAEEIIIPERYDGNRLRLLNQLVEGVMETHSKGKRHHLIINAEGIGHSYGMAKDLEEATGIETRASILGHVQRGGSPTAKDRGYASYMSALAVDLLCAGASNRVVGYRNGQYVDYDIDEALSMRKDVDEYEYQISRMLGRSIYTIS